MSHVWSPITSVQFSPSLTERIWFFLCICTPRRRFSATTLSRLVKLEYQPTYHTASRWSRFWGRWVMPRHYHQHQTDPALHTQYWKWRRWSEQLRQGEDNDEVAVFVDADYYKPQRSLSPYTTPQLGRSNQHFSCALRSNFVCLGKGMMCLYQLIICLGKVINSLWKLNCLFAFARERLSRDTNQSVILLWEIWQKLQDIFECKNIPRSTLRQKAWKLFKVILWDTRISQNCIDIQWSKIQNYKYSKTIFTRFIIKEEI